jgi:diguanylate cyclase (GGDEF)-like protein/PAS domain S-box-containing protein
MINPEDRPHRRVGTRQRPVRVLVLSGDAALADALSACCCTLGMALSSVRDTLEAADALVQGEAEIAVVDADLGIRRVVELGRRARIDRCVDWAPMIVVGNPATLRPQLRQIAPGVVDHIISKPLIHEELHLALVAARRTVSLKRAFDGTLDHISEAVVVIDESGQIRNFNAAAQRLFQWQVSEMLAANISRLMPERHRHEHDAYVAAYQITGQARVIGKGRIETGQRRDGSQFPMHLTVSDISDSYGTRFVGVIRDLTQDREAEHLRRQALHDALTGLPNHAHAQEQLRAACDAAQRGGDGFALVYLDLDRFKPVNDVHGHRVGDQVLRAVARRMRHGLNEADLVARMGGDEFLVLLRRVTRTAQAEAVVRRLHELAARPIVLDVLALTVGLSAGIAVYGTDGTTPESLLHAADQAMYARKRLGRNSIHVTVPGQGAR